MMCMSVNRLPHCDSYCVHGKEQHQVKKESPTIVLIALANLAGEASQVRGNYQMLSQKDSLRAVGPLHWLRATLSLRFGTRYNTIVLFGSGRGQFSSWQKIKIIEFIMSSVVTILC